MRAYAVVFLSVLLAEIGDKTQLASASSPSAAGCWCADERAGPSAHMPALELTEADVRALATYLGTLR
jgi:hypothetical protein